MIEKSGGPAPRRRRGGAFDGAAALLLLAALSAPQTCGAVLYNTSAGYQYMAGSRDYWGHDVWSYGGLRLEGGWYPYGVAAAFNDQNFRWGVAPGVGLQKGIPGWGRPRTAYTHYSGELRREDLRGSAHAFEFGWFRAWTTRLSGDVSYRYLTGDLFGAVNEVYDQPAGPARVSLRRATYHEGRLALIAAVPLLGRSLRVELGLASSHRVGGASGTTESLAFGWPLLGRAFLRGGLVLAQNDSGPARILFNSGLSYGLSGRFAGE
jgi:hypothetical protein